MKIPIKRYKINKDHLPKGLIAEGVTYAILVAILALSILYVIPIQSKVKGNVVLYSKGLPYSINTITDGPLHLITTKNTAISKGQLIATQVWDINESQIQLLESLAQFKLQMKPYSVDSLQRLTTQLNSLKIENLQGQIDAIYSAINQYNILYAATNNNKVAQGIEDEINRRQATLSQLNQKKGQYEKSIALLQRQLASDSLLYTQGVISYRDYDDRKIELFQAKEKIAENESEKELIKNEIASIYSRRNDISAETAKESAHYFLKIYDRLDRFKEDYYAIVNRRLIYAPISGNIEWDIIGQDGNEYMAGETFATITPTMTPSKQALYYITVPISKSGQIEKGQQVFIDLEEYIPQEYGYLRAEVISKESGPLEGGFYRVLLSLSNGFKTSYGVELPVQPIYHGTGEILLNKQSIASKIKKEFSKRSAEIIR